MADVSWIGTVSTLAGTIVGAVAGGVVQSWRDRRARLNEMQTRWDKTLLDGMSSYLGSADLAWRGLRRLHEAGLDDPLRPELMKQADEAVEKMHEVSNLISLLTGPRDHPMRVAARNMRVALKPLKDAGHENAVVDHETINSCFRAWRTAREELLGAVQQEYLR